MITENESKLVGALESNVNYAEKPQKGGSNGGMVLGRRKRRIKENKVHGRGLSSDKSKDNDPGNSSSAFTSDSN